MTETWTVTAGPPQSQRRRRAPLAAAVREAVRSASLSLRPGLVRVEAGRPGRLPGGIDQDEVVAQHQRRLDEGESEQQDDGKDHRQLGRRLPRLEGPTGHHPAEPRTRSRTASKSRPTALEWAAQPMSMVARAAAARMTRAYSAVV